MSITFDSVPFDRTKCGDLKPFTATSWRDRDGKIHMEFHCPPEPMKEPGRWHRFPVAVEVEDKEQTN